MDMDIDLSRFVESAETPEPRECKFQSLHRDIRCRIYWYYLYQEGSRILTVPPPANMVPPPPDMDPHSADLGRRGYYYRGCSCNALSYAQRLRTRDTIIDINLAYTSKFFSHEVLTCMYSKMTFVFQCTCSILYHISTNNILSDSLERIKFFWAGHMSDEAFVALSQLPLRRLTAVIGDFTTRFLTSQETIFRRYFLRPTIHITQALGLPELLQLRDLESVRVVCYGSAYILMSEDDRLGLEHLLREFLTRRRVKTEDEYASD